MKNAIFQLESKWLVNLASKMLKVIFNEKLLHNFWIYIQFTYIQFMSFQVFASILMAYNYKLAYSNLTEIIIEKKVNGCRAFPMTLGFFFKYHKPDLLVYWRIANKFIPPTDITGFI